MKAEGGVKVCSRCERGLGVYEFNRNRAATDGLQHWCRDCSRANDRARSARGHVQSRRYYQKSGEYIRAMNRERFMQYAEATRGATRRGRWSEAEVRALVEMRREGYRVVEIASMLDRTYVSTRKKIHDLGCPPRGV